MSNEFIMKELQKYCSTDETRAYLGKPFYADGNLMATSGHVAAFAESDFVDLEKQDNDVLDTIIELSKLFDTQQFMPLSGVKIPERYKCPKCEGSGKTTSKTCHECDGDGQAEAENDHSKYEVECASCDGVGRIGTDGDCDYCRGKGDVLPEAIDFYEGFINTEYLFLVLDYPDLEIAIITTDTGFAHQFLFRSSNGLSVLIMGQRFK